MTGHTNQEWAAILKTWADKTEERMKEYQGELKGMGIGLTLAEREELEEKIMALRVAESAVLQEGPFNPALPCDGCKNGDKWEAKQ